jgi:superfamily II DNA/RNA helicase
MSNRYTQNKRTGDYDGRGQNRGGGVPRNRGDGYGGGHGGGRGDGHRDGHRDGHGGGRGDGPRIRPIEGRRNYQEEQDYNNNRFDFARALKKAEDLLEDEELVFSPGVKEESVDKFVKMGLKDEILCGLTQGGFDEPSDVQSMAIPQILKGREVIVQNQSGTGKSLAFITSCLQTINPELKAPQAIILSPTGPLTIQTYTVCRQVAEFMEDVNIACLTKGVDREKNVRELGNSDNENEIAQIVVATPGRLKDILTEFPQFFQHIKIFVVDECDEILSGTFKDQFKEIIKRIPSRTTMQMCMFSATMSDEVLSITEKILRNPIKILIKKEKMTLDGIKQTYIDMEKDGQVRNKANVLLQMLKVIPIQKLIIYVNRIETANDVQQLLKDDGYDCLCINGEMSSIERSEVLKEFKRGSTHFLISTDLLSRGIDIQQLTLVVNYELPGRNKIECYIHRIGRTGRFGKKGLAINIVNKHERELLNIVQNTFKCEIGPLKNTDLNHVLNG